MKKLLLIYFSLSMLNFFGQTPDYFANNPNWHCGLYDSNQWGNDPNGPYEEHYVYYLNGEELISGNTYHKVYRRGYKDYTLTQPQLDTTFDEQTPYYIRQVGKTIRFIGPNNPIDTLLVSYDYTVGDTVLGNVFNSCFSMDTIQKIDSVLVGSDYRQVFYLDSINGPIITEGIGHQLYLQQSSGGFIEPLCEGIGFDYKIHCYGQNNTSLWGADGNSSCVLNVGISESLNSELFFTITPNPAVDYINISPTLLESFTIYVYDINGKQLMKSKESKIDVSKLAKGLYQIEIRDKQNNKGVRKLIKQ